MKPQQKPKLKKTDTVGDKREKGFNVYFGGANKNFADDLNLQKKQEDNKLKRYQSRNKTDKAQRNSVSGNQLQNAAPKVNKWAIKNRNTENPLRSPPIINSRLNNRVKDEDLIKDFSELSRAVGYGQQPFGIQAESEGVQREPGREDV